jgi:hypothetical protein
MPPATGTAVYTRRPEAVGVAAAVIEARKGFHRNCYDALCWLISHVSARKG